MYEWILQHFTVIAGAIAIFYICFQVSVFVSELCTDDDKLGTRARLIVSALFSILFILVMNYNKPFMEILILIIIAIFAVGGIYIYIHIKKRSIRQINLMKLPVKQRASFILNIIRIIFFFCGGLCLIYLGSITAESWDFLSRICNLFGILFLIMPPLYPGYLGSDISEDIPKIKKLKEENKEFEKLKIRHPKLLWIIFLSLGIFVSVIFLMLASLTDNELLWTLGSASTFLGIIPWFIALYMASGDVTVTISEEVAVKSGVMVKNIEQENIKKK